MNNLAMIDNSFSRNDPTQETSLRSWRFSNRQPVSQANLNVNAEALAYHGHHMLSQWQLVSEAMDELLGRACRPQISRYLRSATTVSHGTRWSFMKIVPRMLQILVTSQQARCWWLLISYRVISPLNVRSSRRIQRGCHRRYFQRRRCV